MSGTANHLCVTMPSISVPVSINMARDCCELIVTMAKQMEVDEKHGEAHRKVEHMKKTNMRLLLEAWEEIKWSHQGEFVRCIRSTHIDICHDGCGRVRCTVKHRAPMILDVETCGSVLTMLSRQLLEDRAIDAEYKGRAVYVDLVRGRQNKLGRMYYRGKPCISRCIPSVGGDLDWHALEKCVADVFKVALAIEPDY